MSENKEAIVTPSSRPWLNEDFFKTVIRNDLKTSDEITIRDYSCKNAVKNGENYSSELLRLFLNFSTCNQINVVTDYNNSYIVKCMHPEEVGTSKILKDLNVFGKEVTMYTETLPALAEVIKATGFSGELMPRMLYYTSDPRELMVLEDLTTLGFRCQSRRDGLDREHCEMVFTRLAQVHAASMVLNTRDPKFRATYNKGGFFASMPESLSSSYCNGVRQGIDVMRKLPELHKYVSYYEEYVEDMTRRGIELIRRVPDEEDQYNVLNHGDFWLANMMFKYDGEKPVEVRFVDFQMSTFGNCGLDINYFFFTSVEEKTRGLYRQALLQMYQETLEDVLVKSKHQGFIPTFKDLEDKLYESKDIALMTPCIVLPLVKLDKESSKTISVDQVMDSRNNTSGGNLYGNELFIEALKIALGHLEDIGFIKLE